MRQLKAQEEDNKSNLRFEYTEVGNLQHYNYR